jgi:hypothetical protein
MNLSYQESPVWRGRTRERRVSETLCRLELAGVAKNASDPALLPKPGATTRADRLTSMP